MAKQKKKQGKATTQPAVPPSDAPRADEAGLAPADENVVTPVAESVAGTFSIPSEAGWIAERDGVPRMDGARTRAVAAVPRWRRWLPDLVKAALALAVIGVAAAIWYQPPLVKAGFPYVSYTFRGQPAERAVLFRPLAMPTRYYVALPERLAERYHWFAVDRRREVVALAEAPQRRILGRPAIRRSDPLGLDLEFRTLDGSEWRIFFLEDAIVFSNALLSVRLDTRQTAPQP